MNVDDTCHIGKICFKARAACLDRQTALLIELSFDELIGKAAFTVGHLEEIDTGSESAHIKLL